MERLAGQVVDGWEEGGKRGRLKGGGVFGRRCSQPRQCRSDEGRRDMCKLAQAGLADSEGSG